MSSPALVDIYDEFHKCIFLSGEEMGKRGATKLTFWLHLIMTH